MRIDVDTLAEEGESFAHTYGVEDLSLDDERARLIEGAEIRGRAKREDSQVRLHGMVAARTEVACDRCLRPVVVPVETEFDATYIPAALDTTGAGEAAELQADEMDVDIYEGNEIDIDRLVREQVLLALPVRLLCSEECKGLCPTCGADLNTETCACEQRETDPRWAALANLKQDVK